MAELHVAVWSCASHKAPGHDGINFLFYKKAWGTIKDDIFILVCNFFHTGKLPTSIKSSFICLIPKKCPAIGVDDYRPISLIHGLYKIIAKLLANRLKVCWIIGLASHNLHS